MESVASRQAKPKKTEKHIAPPASLEEISRGLGVTSKEKAIVRRVLTELGYVGKQKSVRSKVTPENSARPRTR
jgi:hypothetical protein